VDKCKIDQVSYSQSSFLTSCEFCLARRVVPMIAHYPDVDLTVVLKDNDQNSSNADDSIGNNQSTLLSSSGDATITETNTHGQVPVAPLQPIEIKMSLHTPCHRCSTYSHMAPVPTQGHSAESNRQSTDEPSARKSLGASNDSFQSENMHQLQFQIDQVSISFSSKNRTLTVFCRIRSRQMNRCINNRSRLTTYFRGSEEWIRMDTTRHNLRMNQTLRTSKRHRSGKYVKTLQTYKRYCSNNDKNLTVSWSSSPVLKRCSQGLSKNSQSLDSSSSSQRQPV